MRFTVLFFILFPLFAKAATDEQTKVTCLDELGRYEFTRSGEILPDSHWDSVVLRVSNTVFYEWNGEKIRKNTISTDPRGFTSTSTRTTIWTRVRAKYNSSGLVRASKVTPDELSWVLTNLISQSMSELHARMDWSKSYRGFSIARIVDTCGEVPEARVKMRRHIHSARVYRMAVHQVLPQLFLPAK